MALAISKIRNIMRQDANVEGDDQRLRQLIWMFLLKVIDSKEEEWALLEEDYEPIIPVGYRWRDWVKSTDPKNKLTGKELTDFVNDKLFPVLAGNAIKNENGEDVYLFENNSELAELIKAFMGECKLTNLMADGTLLREVLEEVDLTDFQNAKDKHEFNVIYESLLKDFSKINGEFYTQRPITKFIVEKLEPTPEDNFADFAAGTGGFGVDFVENIMSQSPTKEQIDNLSNSVYLVEKKPMPYALAVTNMLLHGVKCPNVTLGNTLERSVSSYTQEEKFSKIGMNPPYGGSEMQTTLLNFPENLRSSETADLFMVEIMYRLKINGKAGVILPDSIMFGSDKVKIEIKKKLLTEFNLHTIIRLPGSCFAPYTGIPTNILFFDNTEKKTDFIWFYRWDLQDGKKFSFAKNPMKDEHLDVVREWWDNRREIKDVKENETMTETWKSKKISVKEIEDANYSFDFCGYPNIEKVILSPEETIKNFKEERERLNKEMDSKLDEILKLLGLKED